MNRILIGALVALTALPPTQFQLASIQTGSGAPSAGDCTATRSGNLYVNFSNGRLYACDGSGAWVSHKLASENGGSLPSGAIFAVTTGPCPSGSTEADDLTGTFALWTTNGAGNVGTTGGANDITPAGTNSAPTFTGSALGTHSHGAGTLVPNAHSGTAVADHASHTHTYTDVPNHVHPENNNSATTGGLVGWGAQDTSTNTSSATGYNTGNPVGGVATGTTAGPSATLTHSVTQPSTHTMSGSSEAVSGGTPAGTNSAPTFTGTQFDNRPAFMRLIPCRAN